MFLLGSCGTFGSQYDFHLYYRGSLLPAGRDEVLATYLAFLTLSLWWGWRIGVLYFNLAKMEV